MSKIEIVEQANTLTDEQWLDGEAWLNRDFEPHATLHGLTWLQWQDLLTHVRKIASKLEECERDTLAGTSNWGQAATFAAAVFLCGCGLMRWKKTSLGMHCVKTPKGNSVIRALEEQRDSHV